MKKSSQYVFPGKILFSSSEGAPWAFKDIPPFRSDHKSRIIVETERTYLKTADYTLEGHINAIQIERKSLSDLYGTLTHGRDRFEAELARMDMSDHPFVIVEDSIATMCNPKAKYEGGWVSEADPKSIYGSVIALQIRFKAKWVFADSRRMAEIYAFSLLERFLRDMNKKGKES